jgi:hypothetical protein
LNLGIPFVATGEATSMRDAARRNVPVAVEIGRQASIASGY